MPTLQTKLAALEKVLEGIQSGTVNPSVMGTCRYHDDVTYLRCGVGILFNDAQIEDIKKRRLNGASVQVLAMTIGRRNIEAVTGMSVDDLRVLQSKHDGCSTLSFRKYIESEMEEVRYEINAAKRG